MSPRISSTGAVHFDHMPELFREYLTGKRIMESSFHAYISDVNTFLEAWRPWLAVGVTHIPAETFKPYAIAYLVNVRDLYAASTLARKACAIRHLSIALYGVDHLVSYKPPRVATGTAHPLPNGNSDLDLMLAAAVKPWHKAIIALCGMAGLRISEARRIRVRDFMQDDEGITWATVTGKGDKARRVPVVAEAWVYIQPLYVMALLTGQDDHLFHVGDTGARKAIRETAKKAGITRPVASHDLRHTFGTEVYSATKDIRVTQELLGHASPETTKVYTGISESTKVDAAIRGMARSTT